MTPTPEQESLLRAYTAAAKKVAGCLPMRSGGASAETEYAVAYQALVRSGLAPQLRAKYRLGAR